MENNSYFCANLVIDMATDLQTRLNSLKAKTQVLVEKYAALEDERRRLEAMLAERDEAIGQRDRIISDLQSRIGYLKASVTVSPSREDVEQTRSLIAGLVREIDKCILELTD